ncbi:MAG: putative metal-binding motif-containing protein [Myxococcales bacterium]|nr:putative metal-binding motif-containing protein [Myxococcales bacterium]
MHRVLRFSVLAFFLLSTACDGDGPGDGDGGDADGGGGTMDGGGGGACASAADGTECGSSMICVGGACVTATCGDGFMSMGEECDDANDVAFDGCEPGTCTFTCHEDPECDDGRVCNGAELCNASTHVCTPGTAPAPGTTCDLGGGSGVCRGTDCVDPGCGNGVTDGTEDCDDGNDVDGDGCDTDCTFSCTEDLDCIDGDVCTGDETCDTTAHTCTAGTPLDCDDGNACTADECDSIAGCQNPLIDMDMDGHASDTLGACGDDCNDMRGDVYTGAEELCDGVDNNCNGDTDEVAPTWYIDCDDDNFAADTDGSRTGCTEPPASATGCGGGWTTTRPVSISSTDCNDNNADVFPGQTAWFTGAIPGEPGNYDYNCDGNDSTRYGCGPSDGTCGGTCTGGYQPYNSSTNPNGCRISCSGSLCLLLDWPRCGESAQFLSCGRVGSLCLSTRPSNLAQQCH